MSKDNSDSRRSSSDGVHSTANPDSAPDEFGYDKNIFGDKYIPQLSPGGVSGGKTLTSTSEDGEMYAGPTIRREFERGAAHPEQATWFGYWEDRAGLRTREVGVSFKSWFRHATLSGETGVGKTTVLINGMLQIAYSGWGFCFIDPGGDAVYDLLKRIPEYRLDDVIWVQPPTGKYDQVTALNFLEVNSSPEEPDSAYDARVASVVEELISIVGGDEEMYARMTRLLRTVAQAMIEADEKYTLLDVYQVLNDESLQDQFQEHVSDPVVRDGVRRLSEDIEQVDVEPLTGRIDKWVMNKTARRIVSHKQSTVDIGQAVEDGKIILVNSSPSNISTSIGKIIASSIVQRIWATVKSRSEREGKDERTPYWMIIDELDEAISQQTDLEEMLADARKYRLALWTALQYPHQLEEERREAVMGNSKSVMAMKTTETKSAVELMNQMDEYEKRDLMNLGEYEMYTRVDTKDGISPPLRIQTFAPYPPLRDDDAVEEIIKRSVDRYGTSESGVDPENTTVQRVVNGEVPTENPEIDIQTDNVLEAIHAVEIRQETGRGSFVTVDSVRDELERFGDGELGYTSHFSSVIEQLPEAYVNIERRSGEIVVSLTQQGRDEAVQYDTGAGSTGGGHKHRYLLRRSYEVFTRLGCNVKLYDQDTDDELPDAVGKLPVETEMTVSEAGLEVGEVEDMSVQQLQELASQASAAVEEEPIDVESELAKHHEMLPSVTGGRDITIEAETTTISRPGRTLQNLKKAIVDNRRCVMCVPDGTASNTTGINSFEDWARKGQEVLTTPSLCKFEGADGSRELYQGNKRLEIDGIPVLRPAELGKTSTWVDPGEINRRTEWGAKRGDTLILEAQSGDEICRVAAGDIESGDIDPESIPAWGEYEPTEQAHAVHTINSTGEVTTTRYRDKDQFKSDWKHVHEPFVPELEFPREPTGDDWEILIFPDDNNTEYTGPQLFNVESSDSDGVSEWSVTSVFENEVGGLNTEYPDPTSNETPDLSTGETEPSEGSNTPENNSDDSQTFEPGDEVTIPDDIISAGHNIAGSESSVDDDTEDEESETDSDDTDVDFGGVEIAGQSSERESETGDENGQRQTGDTDNPDETPESESVIGDDIDADDWAQLADNQSDNTDKTVRTGRETSDTGTNTDTDTDTEVDKSQSDGDDSDEEDESGDESGGDTESIF